MGHIGVNWVGRDDIFLTGCWRFRNPQCLPIELFDQTGLFMFLDYRGGKLIKKPEISEYLGTRTTRRSSPDILLYFR